LAASKASADDIAKLKQRAQIACQAMLAAGVSAKADPTDQGRGFQSTCYFEGMTCNMSGHIGDVLTLTRDRGPGIKGFRVSVYLGDPRAVNNRQSREQMLEKEQKNNPEWEYWKPSPDSLMSTQKYYRTKFQWHSGEPHAQVNGEIYVCDINVNIFAEIMGKEVLKVFSQQYLSEIIDEKRTEDAAKALGAQLQQEVKAKLQTLYQAIKPTAQCEKPEQVEIPELPLVIPAADLGGDYKAELTTTKGQVEQQRAASKKEVKFCGQAAVEGAIAKPIKDSIRTLQDWFKQSKPTLDAEEKTRLASEEFFAKLLPRHYRLMTDPERTKLEQALLDRGLALRRYRTVQRGVIRQKSGFTDLASPATTAVELISSCQDLDAYYTALSRFAWAGLEIESLARIAGPINSARVGAYATYAIAELAESKPDPRMVKTVEDQRRRHFETLIDMGIIATIASELRFEAMIDARKDRLYGIKEAWTGEVHQDPQIEKALKANLSGVYKAMDVVTSTVNSLGFGLLDVVAGMGADVVRSPLSLFFPDTFKTRWQKLEQQRSDHWEKTQFQILALRQLRQKPAPDVQKLAEQMLGGDTNPAKVAGLIAAAIGKVEPAAIKDLIEDRTFAEATDGGFYRIMGSMLIDFGQRGRMEMAITREKTRLMWRDMETALRVVEGRDPETGDLTWGTLISPTAWADITLKSQVDVKMRGTAINAKAGQMADMFRLEPVLYKAAFNFAELPPEMGEVHKKLLNTSVPYIEFVQRIDQERRGRYLYSWRRWMPDALYDAAAFALKQYEVMNRDYAITDARGEQRRAAALTLQDYLYAADFAGALSYSKYMAEGGCDGDCAKTYQGVHKMLLEAYAWDRFKDKQVSFLRPLGDLGFFSYGIGAVGRMAGALGIVEVEAAGAAAGQAGGAAQRQTFLQYLYESVNPFAAPKLTDALGKTVGREWSHAVRNVLVQSFTEVIVGDMLVPIAGQEYEPLLMQPVMLALSQATQKNPKRKTFKNVEKLLEQAIITEKTQNGERIDIKKYLAEIMGMPVVQAEQHLETLLERQAKSKEPAVRESIDRQAKADQRILGSWARLQQVAESIGKLRESLAKAVGDKKQATYEKLRTAYRAVEDVLLPPTMARYDALLQTRPAELFDYEKGWDIDRIREHFRTMRSWARPEHRQALDRLEARVDQQRMTRFMLAMQEFLSAHGGSLVGNSVILNGTRAGNPEYKGIFSDLDFTVVTTPGVDQAAIKKALDAIFEKQHIVLDAKGRKPSANIEAMVQDFLPGEVRTIKTLKEFEQWALELPKDPHRYLSGGGAEWVGGYNFLNGETVSLSGGKAVIDQTPNPQLIPKPEVDPISAHGLVLDQMRFDTYAPLSDAGTLGDMIGDRAKVTLRYVDAIIGAKYPDLVRMRTREAAQRNGYHALVVEDAHRLVTEGILTQQEFQLIQRLYEIKAGKTVFQTMQGVTSGRDIEASRGALEFIWKGMDDLGRRAYTLTREAYVKEMDGHAKALADHPKGPEVLATLAFRVWNAAQKINTKEQPQKMAQLSGDPNANPKALKLQDQQRIAVTMGVEPVVLDKFEPLPVAQGQGGFPVYDGDPPWFRSGDRPHEGAEPIVRPTVLRTAAMPVTQPANPRSGTLAEIFEPLPNGTYLRGEGGAYVVGKQVGAVRDLWEEPYHQPNEVVAYKLGRMLDGNIPYSERGPRQSDGQVISITRWVEGSVPLVDAVRVGLKGTDAAGKPLALKVSLEQHLARLREAYIKIRLIAALLGDFDRKGNNFAITRDGHLVGIDFEKAQPFEHDLTPEKVAEMMAKRFAGNPESRGTTEKYRQLDRDVGVTWEEAASVWKKMKSRLLDAEGKLKPEAAKELEALAGYYGDALKTNVLETWKVRIAEMEGVVGKVFGEDLRAKYDLKPPATDSGGPILFAQIGVSPSFSKAGRFKGATIEEVAAKLKSGEYTPDDLPVQFIWVNGQKVVVNNRSLTTLSKAGMKPTKMEDMTGRLPKDGPDSLESVLQRLEEMGGKPSKSIPVRETDDRGAPAKEVISLPE
jgi:hypothetical protein